MRLKRHFAGLVLLPVLIFSGSLAHAMTDLRPDKVRVADEKKSKTYLQDGMIVGGDSAINQVVVKDIRRAKNRGFERVVIDLDGTHNGEPVAIQRAPYFQVSVTPDEKRVVFTLFGHTELAFNAKKVAASFKKSAAVRNLILLPRLEDDAWTIAFDLKSDAPVEVFELSKPVRVIMDFQTKR